MFGYLLIVAGAALAAAGVDYERRKGEKGWDKFRLDKLEGGRIPPLLEDKIRELAAGSAAAEIVIAKGRDREAAEAERRRLEAEEKNPK